MVTLLKSQLIKTLALGVAVAVAMTFGTVATAQDKKNIDTSKNWNSTNFIFPFGETNTATYGQTFTVEEGNILDSFTFFLYDTLSDFYPDGTDQTDFAAYVMEWDGEKATGSMLYESEAQSTDRDVSFQEFTFNTGGLNLTTGKQYVAFISSSNFFDGVRGTSNLGYLYADVYEGGGFVYLNNGSDFSQITTTQWETAIGNGVNDTAFKASFSSASTPVSVPEPTSVVSLLGVCALAAGSVLKDKRKQKN